MKPLLIRVHGKSGWIGPEGQTVKTARLTLAA